MKNRPCPSHSGEIEQLAFGGSGILRSSGLVLFVPFTAPQDKLTVKIVKQKKQHALAQIDILQTPSPHRVTPRCPHFQHCGGCQFQHLDYQQQLKAKQQFVQDALERQAGIKFSLHPIVPSPSEWSYRQHIRLNLRPKENGFEAGYIGSDFVPISECLLFHEEKDPLFSQIKECLALLSNRGIKEGSLRIFKLASSYLFAFSFFPYLPENRRAVFSTFPIPTVMQSPRQKDQFGTFDCQFTLLGLKFSYSPYSFLQNNLPQSEQLYQTILSLTEAEEILDLYCGIGITTLLFAKRGAQILGIESNAKAIQHAQHNAQYNQVTHAEFLCSDVENATLPKAPCVLINPPRTGLSPPALAKILTLKPKEILYVSCMPSTLARDLKHFISASYTLKFAQAFDMFPQTTHVETLVHLTL